MSTAILENDFGPLSPIETMKRLKTIENNLLAKH